MDGQRRFMEPISPCPQCGATFAEPGVSCASRFDRLLALDHSRTEPWGTRHGLAFAAFTLQHAFGKPREALERAYVMLYRVYEFGDDRMKVAGALRGTPPSSPAEWGVPPLPPVLRGEPAWGMTIADLGSFSADEYAGLLDSWCKAILDRLSVGRLKRETT